MYLYFPFSDICKISNSFPELTLALDNIILSFYMVSEAKTAWVKFSYRAPTLNLLSQQNSKLSGTGY